MSTQTTAQIIGQIAVSYVPSTNDRKRGMTVISNIPDCVDILELTKDLKGYLNCNGCCTSTRRIELSGSHVMEIGYLLTTLIWNEYLVKPKSE
jgi:translation initiation factor 1 (eIF-1/SUI1)